MKSSLKTILALAGLTIGSFALASSQPAKAASAISGTTDCPASGNSSAISSDCYATPDELKVTFYEMGFCTSDPLTTDTFNSTNCQKGWENSSGQTIDIANCLTIDCNLDTGKNYRVDNATYTHAYAIMDSSQTVKGRAYYNDKTYYTTATDRVHPSTGKLNGAVPSTDSADFAANTQVVDEMGGGDGCWDWEQSTTKGTVKAVLTNTSLVTATNASTCSSSARLVGSVEMSSSLTMTNAVSGYKMTWHVTNLGMFVDSWTGKSPDNVYAMEAGPFVPSFELR